MKWKRLIPLCGLILVIGFAVLSSQSMRVVSDKEHAYLGGLTWYKSYPKALEKARAEGKPLLVYFWASWCKYCAKLESEVYPSQEVKKLLTEEFVLIAINLDEDSEIPQKYNVRYPPAEIFITPEEEVLTEIMGYTPKENFLLYIQEALSKFKASKLKE